MISRLGIQPLFLGRKYSRQPVFYVGRPDLLKFTDVDGKAQGIDPDFIGRIAQVGDKETGNTDIFCKDGRQLTVKKPFADVLMDVGFARSGLDD